MREKQSANACSHLQDGMGDTALHIACCSKVCMYAHVCVCGVCVSVCVHVCVRAANLEIDKTLLQIVLRGPLSQSHRGKQPTPAMQHTAAHCNTLHYTATHCNTLPHTTTNYNTLQHIKSPNRITQHSVRAEPTLPCVCCRHTHENGYVVATISRLLKIIGLFCRI